MDTARQTGAPATDPAVLALRRPIDHADLQLTPEAEALIASFDESLRPHELAARFPRIMNQMARIWKRPTQLDRYFEELLLDTRGKRQGFPLKVLLELTSLKEYYQSSTFPTPYTVWDEAKIDERHR